MWLLPLQIALGSTAALGQQTTAWTGAAGPGLPFWDEAANWSNGAPDDPLTDTLLDGFDTTLRSGRFTARRINGTGLLTLAGGELQLHGNGSSLGTLDVRAGRMRAGSMALQQLRIGTAGEYVDDADADYLLIGLDSGLWNDGLFRKTGSGTTKMEIHREEGFVNRGRFILEAGTIDAFMPPGGTWDNAGTIEVRGGSFSLQTYRAAVIHSGVVHVQGGSMHVSIRGDGGLFSTGQWQVDAGATLQITGELHEWNSLRFAPGTLHNDGHLILARAEPEFEDHRGPMGRGIVELRDGSRLSLTGDFTPGALVIGDRLRVDDYVYRYNSVVTTGAITVDRLDWGMGTISAPGGVTVNGPARLHGWAPTDSGFYGKQFDQAYVFHGETEWVGDSDLTGSGSLTVGPAGVFLDRQQGGGLPEYQDPGTVPGSDAPMRIALAGGLRIEGGYRKTGPGWTIVESEVANTGRIEAIDAGTLTFARRLDNQGTLEAVRSRIVALGGLAQYHPTAPGSDPDADGSSLDGGRYIARDGSIVIGQTAAYSGSATDFLLSKVHHNNAYIVLDGPRARLSLLHYGEEHDALSRLWDNRGSLVLLNGARLHTESGLLSSSGTVAIGDGSRLEVGDLSGSPGSAYRQSGLSSATWLAGTLAVRDAGIDAGVFGPGLAGEIGMGRVEGDLRFGAASIFDVDVASLASFDQLRVDGTAQVDGLLAIEFLGGVAPGTYRLLHADAGLAGSFAALTSNLDPSRYTVSVAYGARDLELSVIAVPEPGTWALTAGGLAIMAAGARRRATRKRVAPAR